MFQFIPELWKAQQYTHQDCQFEIPQTFILQGKVIEWYFTSNKCPGKLLKKRKQNTSIKNVLCLQSCCFMRLYGTQVHVKYLTRKELEILIEDATTYPDLYENVILQETFASDIYISFNRDHHVRMVRQRIPQAIDPLITQDKFATEGCIFENRIMNISKEIEKMLSITQSKVNKLEIIYKYIDRRVIAVWCPIYNSSLEFISTNNYLFNQKLYDTLNPAKKPIVKVIKCACCFKFTEDNHAMLKNKLWQIRMHRNLHHLNDQTVNHDQTGRIRPLQDQFKFVEICTACYDAFLELIKRSPISQKQVLYSRPIYKTMDLNNTHDQIEDSGGRTTVQTTYTKREYRMRVRSAYK